MVQRRPVCTILGGPNGSGKSSIVDALKPIGTFINADEAARRIAPANSEAASLAAGRLVIRQLDALIRDQASFVYETTLSGLQPIGVVRRAKQAGYEIDIVFVVVATVELNIRRVAQRVAQGGHDIQEAVIRRRHGKAFANLATGIALADEVVVLNNTGLETLVLLRIASQIVMTPLRRAGPRSDCTVRCGDTRRRGVKGRGAASHVVGSTPATLPPSSRPC